MTTFLIHPNCRKEALCCSELGTSLLQSSLAQKNNPVTPLSFGVHARTLDIQETFGLLRRQHHASGCQARSTGDDVTFLQERLNSRPPTALPLLTPDGKFGAKTLARVQEFQGNHALTVDGIVGPLTWGSLLGHTVAKTTGFFVLGRDLYDRLGARVVLRGVNKMSVFDNDDPLGLISFPEIKQTGANTVRIVWAIATTDRGRSPQRRPWMPSSPTPRPIISSR